MVSDEQAIAGAMAAWRRQDEQAADVIRGLLEKPDAEKERFVERLRSAAGRDDAAPELATLVSGGPVEKLVQIAQADNRTSRLGPQPKRADDELQTLLEIPLAADDVPPTVAQSDCYRVGVSRSKYSESEDP